MTIQINADTVNTMAGSAEEAASLVDGTTQTLSDGGAVASASGMDGFATADVVGDVWARWLSKSAACRDSVEYFAEALRATASTLATTDADNAEFVYPAGSPVVADGPPWTRPQPYTDDRPPVGPPDGG
ncbi:hypothetical protein [Stackebrandtia nassauensis]|uniref:Uncharacterized protein n=1 Tax=Stackebrandtia nassauensis (strain DSM 44728 / CIP 108903 / NRRL B-16338 / NBRC 102104 / LLR-40K-21) TaxID=446470 RepID=D3PZU1_STANL|nr:hypothetical protein [Stackebrandtia nassauensis]ADD43628.1 hypothetical protein Snas_3976 [Stackebrandtia nassauensis DSM 44728]